MRSTSTLLLDQQALEYNLRFLKKELGENIRISTVIKGNAYGHGIETYVPMVEQSGYINHFSVFSAEEAYRLTQVLNTTATILIMGFLEESDMRWAIEHGIEFFVFDIGRLEKAVQIARQLGKKAKVHIEVETGMNRTGFDEASLQAGLFTFLREHKNHYSLEGLCTHFAGAEQIANYLRIEHQKKSFLSLRQRFLDQGLTSQYTHTCCSAAAIRLPDMRFNMVRIGILQYGLWPSQEVKIDYLKHHNLTEFNLRRVLSWKTQLMAIKPVKMGEFIGYGNSFQASRDMQIGILPVGYANGYSRALSNSGRVIVNGVRTGVIGTVNMNITLIDLTDIPYAQPGDEVILIGSSQQKEVSIASFGELSNQLNYELLSRLPQDIPRIPLAGTR